MDRLSIADGEEARTHPKVGWRVDPLRRVWAGGMSAGVGRGCMRRLGAAGTLSVPNVLVDLDHRDLGVEPAASKQAQHLLLALAEGLERAPSQQSSEYHKRNQYCCNQVDGAAE